MKYYKDSKMKFTKQDMQNIQTTTDSDGNTFKYGDPIKFFHTFTDKGEIKYQGFIDTVEVSGNVSGVLFNFFDGGMNGRINLVAGALEDMAFYNSDEEMKSAYYSICRKYDAKQAKLREVM